MYFLPETLSDEGEVHWCGDEAVVVRELLLVDRLAERLGFRQAAQLGQQVVTVVLPLLRVRQVLGVTLSHRWPIKCKFA